jgi:hypothetical protein
LATATVWFFSILVFLVVVQLAVVTDCYVVCQTCCDCKFSSNHNNEALTAEEKGNFSLGAFFLTALFGLLAAIFSIIIVGTIDGQDVDHTFLYIVFAFSGTCFLGGGVLFVKAFLKRVV